MSKQETLDNWGQLKLDLDSIQKRNESRIVIADFILQIGSDNSTGLLRGPRGHLQEVGRLDSFVEKACKCSSSAMIDMTKAYDMVVQHGDPDRRVSVGLGHLELGC